jgi:hypothetical protein
VSDLDFVTVRNEQNGIELYCIADFRGQKVNRDVFPFFGAVLFTARFNNSIISFRLQSSLNRFSRVLPLERGKLVYTIYPSHTIAGQRTILYIPAENVKQRSASG